MHILVRILVHGWPVHLDYFTNFTVKSELVYRTDFSGLAEILMNYRLNYLPDSGIRYL